MRLKSWVIPVVFLTSTGLVSAAWPFKSSTPSISSSITIPTSIPSYEELLKLLEQEEDDDYIEIITTISTSIVTTSTTISIPSTIPTIKEVKEEIPFTGLEYRVGTFLFRPSTLKKELAVLLSVILYYLISWFGSSISSKHAKAWFDSNIPILGQEFAQVGMGNKRYEKDGGDEFVSFATGRRAIESVTLRLYTTARHDILMALFNFVSVIAGLGVAKEAEKIVLEFKLRAPEGTPESKFVFAVVTKDAFSSLQAKRWDLRTFTQVIEMSGIPSGMRVMSESNDTAGPVVKDERRAFGLMEGLARDLDGVEYFESLVISDMPAKREFMDEEKPRLPTNLYTLTLTLKLPPIDKVALTQQFITLACNVADVLHSKPALLGPVTIFKLKKARTEASLKLKEPEEEILRLERVTAQEELTVKRMKAEKEAEVLRVKNMSKEERAIHLAEVKKEKAERIAAAKAAEKAEKEQGRVRRRL